jgi:ferredoxin
LQNFLLEGVVGDVMDMFAHVIDPEECIDCTLCVAECPVEAIYAEDDVPDDQRAYIEINAELAKTWKVIIERKDPLPEADKWAEVKNKLQYLER